MIRKITRDVMFLSQKSEPAGKADLPTAQDLLDTLKAHHESCAGMAANMIGIRKNIIAINMGNAYLVMLNPKITKKSVPYETEEGCLSLDGLRKTTRYQSIEVEYQDRNFKRHRQAFEGWTAQVIQHECDHLMGILI